jgi:hypothetical protein
MKSSLHSVPADLASLLTEAVQTFRDSREDGEPTWYAERAAAVTLHHRHGVDWLAAELIGEAARIEVEQDPGEHPGATDPDLTQAITEALAGEPADDLEPVTE